MNNCFFFCAGCEYPPCVSNLAQISTLYSQLLINGQLLPSHLMTLCLYVAFGYFIRYLTFTLLHRRNNCRDRGRLIPQLLGWRTNNVLVPQLLGRSFQKKKFHSKYSHQNEGFSIWVSKNFPGVIPPDSHSGRGSSDPFPHPTPSPAFGWAWDASAPVLEPKPWSPSTF